MNVLGMSEKEIDKYGLPRAIKFKDCDVLVPIPTCKSVKSSMKKLVHKKRESDDTLSQYEAVSLVNMEISKSYFS